MREQGTFGRFLRFLATGGAGFLVDAGLFAGALRAGLAPPLARAIAFCCALSFTFLANRAFTFQSLDDKIWRQFACYVLASSAGGAVNLGVFFLYLRASPIGAEKPFIAFALGVLAGLFTNFLSYSKFVFSR
ncbi:MAG TPA: GtrA family protein [Rhodoblastus sp.]|nr:GtrA family protein [Rhodoblastus sp.]